MAPTLLWLTQTHPPSRGGMAQSSDRLVRTLRRRGLTVHVGHLSARHTRERLETRQGGLDLVVPLEDPVHALHLLQLACARAKLRPDIVVAFGGVHPLVAGPTFASMLGARLVTLLRGNDLDAALYAPNRLATLLRAIEASDATGVLNTDHERKVRALLPGARVHRLVNGIELDWARPTTSERRRAETLRPPGGKLLIGLVGHLKAKKGVVFFLDCVRTSPVVDRVALHLVGELEPALKDAVAAASDELLITHAPFCDRDELLSVYPAFDALALPSFYDGMPNAMLEALALSVPLLSSTAGAMGDILKDGEHGFVFAPGDAHGCREALARFVAQGDEGRARLKAAARALAEEYTAGREGDLLLALLTEVSS